ncbi:copper chaperone PCu(A)C [Deinococcus sp. YIM 134068]|uniref:copper chaperone PCu(A)C n=1 Tax=Deinococcus lichenicola TaxID=3118910 RepID=UPI002F92695B
MLNRLATLTPLLAALALAAVVLPASAGHSGHPAAPVTPAAQSAAPLPLTVRGATVVAVPPGATETSIFMTLHNKGRTPVTLTGVRAAVARHGMLMATRRDSQGRTGMTNVKTLTVPAGGTLRLSATGDHLMLMDFTRPLRVGETLPLTLVGTGGRTLPVKAVVRKP